MEQEKRVHRLFAFVLSSYSLWTLIFLLWATATVLLPQVSVPVWSAFALFVVTGLLGLGSLVWLCYQGGKIWSGLGGLFLGLFFAMLWYASLRWAGPFSPSLRVAGLTGGAITLGAVVSRLIRHANLLPVVAVVVATVDIWNVLMGGLIAQLQVKAPQVISSVSTPLPAPKLPEGVPLGLPLIGLGDLFFLSFFFAGLWRMGLNPSVSLWTALIAVLMNTILVSGPWGLRAIPGLPLICLALLLPHWKAFRYTKEEKKALIVGGVFLIGLLIFFAWAVRVLLTP